MTAVGADEEAVVREAVDVDEAVPLADPIAVDETTELIVVPAFAAVEVEVASSAWSCSCSSSAEAETSVASVLPSTQCLYVLVMDSDFQPNYRYTLTILRHACDKLQRLPADCLR